MKQTRQVRWTEFRRQVRGYGARIIAIEYGVIILALYVADHASLWWWPLIAVVIGHSQWTLTDNIGHYATHCTLFEKGSLNEKLEWLYFFPGFITWKEWKDVHELHHRFVGETRDPHAENFLRWGLSLRKFWLCFLLSPVTDFSKSLSALWVFRNKKLLAFWAGIILAVFFFHLWSLLGLWMIAYFTTRVYIMFFSECSEHWNAELVSLPADKVWGTRNLAGVVYRLYKRHADWLHKLHHQFPGVPPSRLKEFYQARKEADIDDPSVQVWKLPEVLGELE